MSRLLVGFLSDTVDASGGVGGNDGSGHFIKPPLIPSEAPSNLSPREIQNRKNEVGPAINTARRKLRKLCKPVYTYPIDCVPSKPVYAAIPTLNAEKPTLLICVGK